MKGSMKGKIFGTVTVGERGQMVIPAEVRKVFKIKTGDKLIVLAKRDTLSLVPAESFSQFLNEASEIMAKFKAKT
ncbi:MAG: AbrB/MazE/SpoVT family DNA-binding domain-containing protein [Candidatus Omnitrophica bacterium]|nr:AbrB/MazE/SpoVT family DNA-binding domain-containing protein [Candidatus Omnitrophota bacterium]MDD5552528.1 AbrB/MazE/SpoVT family DNA-binding domain-containing protein [Candidatus Omnitrophota bacterium]